jgi:hypothetical protein
MERMIAVNSIHLTALHIITMSRYCKATHVVKPLECADFAVFPLHSRGWGSTRDANAARKPTRLRKQPATSDVMKADG